MSPLPDIVLRAVRLHHDARNGYDNPPSLPVLSPICSVSAGVRPNSSAKRPRGAASLYVCDGHLGFTSGKTDLMGIFDSIRPQGGYPHIHPAFVVFARLAQGLGTIPFRVDIRLAASGQFVAGTLVQHMVFPDRDTIVNMVVTLKGVSFPQPGIFLVELLLDNQWVADTTVELK